MPQKWRGQYLFVGIFFTPLFRSLSLPRKSVCRYAQSIQAFLVRSFPLKTRMLQGSLLRGFGFQDILKVGRVPKSRIQCRAKFLVQ